MTTRRSCGHHPPGWRYVGDAYRGTRHLERVAGQPSLLDHLVEHGNSSAYVHDERESAPWHLERPCRYGNCVDWFCPVCGRYRDGFGPVGCPCEDRFKGTCPDQWGRRAAPVKASDRRRGTRRTAARYRRNKR